MKRLSLYSLPLLLWMAVGSLFVGCEEVEEAGKYDNWRERNQAYIDSIRVIAGDNYVGTTEQADAMEPGKIYALFVPSASTSESMQYVYCKKLVKSEEGERPYYSGYHSTVNAYYYGTYINGEKFDGNFDGYGATDREIPIPPLKAPSATDQYAQFAVTGVISGWTEALQYMRMNERWMLYIPYQCGYGYDDYSNGSSTIMGGSVLVFDVQLHSFAE